MLQRFTFPFSPVAGLSKLMVQLAFCLFVSEGMKDQIEDHRISIYIVTVMYTVCTPSQTLVNFWKLGSHGHVKTCYLSTTNKYQLALRRRKLFLRQHFLKTTITVTFPSFFLFSPQYSRCKGKSWCWDQTHTSVLRVVDH